MKPHWMLAACAVLLGGGLIAQEMPSEPEPVAREVKFKNTDLDGDGKITFDEMKKVHHESLKRLREAKLTLDAKKVEAEEKWTSERLFMFEFLFRDENDDRNLTKEEYIKDVPDDLEISEQDQIDSEDADFDDVLRHDANKDGKVSIDELKTAMVAAMKRYMEIAKGDAGKLEELMGVELYGMSAYMVLSRDGDGDFALTRDENKAYATKMIKGEAPYQLKKPALAKYGDFMCDMYFTLYDKDGDKALTMEELKAAKEPPSDEEFKKIDKNGDGKIDAAELAEAVTAGAGEDSDDSVPPPPDKKEEGGSGKGDK